jgi:mRNA-degrading endonuclease RelE of RelBE toxin-antitoxin system
MAITAQLFDGTTLEFPDDTDHSVIDRVAKEQTLARQKKEEPATEVAHDENSYIRGLKNYLPQSKETWGGVQTMLGAVAEKTLGKHDFSDFLIDRGAKNIKEAQEEQDKISKPNDQFQTALDKGIGTVLTEWLPYQLGQGTANLLESGAAMLAGSTLGSVVPGYGTAAGALGGLLEKQIIKGAAREAAEKILATRGEKAAAEYIADQTKKVVLQSSGILADAAYHGMGETTSRALQEAQKNGGDARDIDMARLAPAALIHTGADFIAEKIGLGTLDGLAKPTQNMLMNIVKSVGVTGLKEIPPEILQSAMERYGANLPVTDRDAINEYIETGAGTIGMSIIPGVIGGMRSRHVQPSPVNPNAPINNGNETDAGNPAGVPNPILSPAIHAPISVIPAALGVKDGIDSTTGVSNRTGLTAADFMSAADAAIQPGERQRRQALAAQQFGLNPPEGIVPATAAERQAQQEAVQQQIDADRFKQQTQPPAVTPAQTIPRTPTAPLSPEDMRQRIDAQSQILEAAKNEPFAFDRNRASAAANVAGGTGAVRGQPNAKMFDINPMSPRDARQRLAMVQHDAAAEGGNPNDFFIVPHPSMSGRFAIEQRNLNPAPYIAPPIQTPEVSPAQAQQRIEAAALQGAEQARLAEDKPRQDMISRAMGNIEERGGVASPYEAQLLQEANMGQPFNSIDEGLTTSSGSLNGSRLEQSEKEFQAELAAEREKIRQQGPNLPIKTTPTVETPEAIEAERQARDKFDMVQQQRRLNELQQQRQAREQAGAERAAVQPESPNPNDVVGAFQTPAPFRSAEQSNLINQARKMMSPLDFSTLQRAGEAPATMSMQDKAHLNVIREGRAALRPEAQTATPELKETVDDIKKKLLPVLRRFGLQKVGLRLVDSIENGTADGAYFKGLITIALDSDKPMGVMRHEIVHALKELGAFTQGEWKVLTDMAKKKWINQFFNQDMINRYQEVYLQENGSLDGFPEYLQEEAIAQAFRYFSETKPPAGAVGNLIHRLNKFFEALGNFFAGKGFKSGEDAFLASRIFSDIERGAITPGRQGVLPVNPNSWKATPADVNQAVNYARENGILPYLSEGALSIRVPGARFAIKAPYEQKTLSKGEYENHPIFGVPLNKNGTVTLYLPTTNEDAKRIVREKTLRGATDRSSRVYLTNESEGRKVRDNPGNIDHQMDGANVMIQVDPQYLQLDQEHPDGRKDFFIPVAEGQAFAKKMAMTKLFTLEKSRSEAISKDTTLKEIEQKITTGVDAFKQLTVKERAKRLKEAKDILKQEHNVGTLLSENGKLQKTRVGDYGLTYDGKSVASMGLGLASAQKINEKLSTCPQAARCEALCLGETSGQNLLYGGEGSQRSGPRLAQYLKTEAMVMHPEEFGILLYHEIDAFRKWAEKTTGTEASKDEQGNKIKVPKQEYAPAIRLNVTSDFTPSTFESIIKALPDVMFYDYTKLNTQTIAPNHHLTYSSTGAAQVVDGKVVGVGSNWDQMVNKMNKGKNVAMAFSSKNAMPEYVVDERTGEKFQVWNGDNYDARFLDPKPGQRGNKFGKGMIVGLTNKDRTGRPEDAAIKNDGFFVDYDPKRDGNTLVIKDQSKLTPVKEQKVRMPGAKYSLRAPTTPEFKSRLKGTKVVDNQGKPLLVYHGTKQYDDYAEESNQAFEQFSSKPTWFGAEPYTANGYAGATGSMYPAFLTIKKPLVIKNFDANDDANKAIKLAKYLGANIEKYQDSNPAYSVLNDIDFVEAAERAGFDGIFVNEGGYPTFAVFQPNQITSAFNERPEKESPRFSLKVTTTPAFKQWFGKSKITNPDGTPKVMYHGTAQDITKFRPKQAGAIFVTDRPDFAEGFASSSDNYVLTKIINGLSDKEKQVMIDKAMKDALADKAINRIHMSQYKKLSIKDQFSALKDYIIPMVRDRQSVGQNIMPLFVRAENPFDYQNPDHINRLVTEMNKDFDDYGRKHGDRDRSSIAEGSWEKIERKFTQDAIRALGFDGFYVNEGGVKNLAVYNPNQLKSAIGNTGAFGLETGDIRYSLKPLTKLADPEPTTVKQITDTADAVFKAVQDAPTRTSMRGALVDKYSGWSQALRSRATYVDGKLRADQIMHSNAQGVNFITNGLQYGIPVVNNDGTLGIEHSENNLVRAAHVADKANLNPAVAASGKSGKFVVAEVARILRGEDILREDADTNAEGRRMIVEADRLDKELKDSLSMPGWNAKGAKIDPDRIAKMHNQINAMRKKGEEKLNVKRELEVTPEHIAWAKDMLAKVPEIREVLDIWKNVNTGLVNLYEKVGMIDKETADKYRANKNYVPLFKSKEDLNEDGSIGFVGLGVKRPPKMFKLKGAELERNIWENVDKQYAAMTAAAYENQTRSIAVEQLRDINPEEAVEVNAGQGNLVYRKDGKDVHVLLQDPNLLTAFQSMTYAMSPVMKFFSGTSKVLRAGALLNPMFWLKQLIRDSVSSTITGSEIVTPFHSAKEFIDLLANRSETGRLLASRGVFGAIDNTLSLQQYIGNLGKERKDPTWLGKAIHKAMEIHEKSDAATRNAIFKKAKQTALKQGMSEEQAIDFAVHKARESINFSIHGASPTLNYIRQMIPFMSATINGLDVLYKAMSGYGLNAEEKAKAQRVFATRAFALFGMSLAYAMMYAGDDDYDKVPDYIKDSNYLMPVMGEDGKKTFVKISTPYEIGFIFKTLPELFVRYMSGSSSGKEVLASFKGGLIQNLPTGGTPIPQGVKPLLEVVTNHSFFTNQPIEGLSDQRLPVSNRGAKASEFSKMLSGLGLDKIGLSPAKIDALSKGYFAEFGTFANEVIDSLIMTSSGKEKPSRNFQNMPFFKAFVTDPNVDQAVSSFYEIEHAATETSNLFSKYKNQGDVEGLNEMINDKEKLDKLAGAKVLGKIQKQMTKLNNVKKMIEEDQSIPPDRRREEADGIQALINQTARTGVKVADQLGIR